MAIITSYPTAPFIGKIHINVRSAMAIIQTPIEDAQFIKKVNVARSLYQAMLFRLIILDLRNTMYKLPTQKMTLPQLMIGHTPRLPLANAQHILLLPLNLTLIIQ